MPPCCAAPSRARTAAPRLTAPSLPQSPGAARLTHERSGCDGLRRVQDHWRQEGLPRRAPRQAPQGRGAGPRRRREGLQIPALGRVAQAHHREEFGAGVDGGEDMDKTGRNYALDAWNKVKKNVTEAYAKLGNEEDRKQYYDYLITNLKLYFDQWESELEGSPEEPTTPEYEAEKEAEDDIGGGEEMGMEEPMPEEGEEDLDFGGL